MVPNELTSYVVVMLVLIAVLVVLFFTNKSIEKHERKKVDTRVHFEKQEEK